MTGAYSRWTLVGLALAAGLAIVLVGNAATDLVLGRAPFADGTLGFIDAPDVAVMHLFDATLPMMVLALCGARSRLLWAAAIGLTTAFSCYAVYQVWRDSLTGFEGGANIGLGLVMLFSPWFILIVLGALALIRRAVRSRASPSLPESRRTG